MSAIRSLLIAGLASLVLFVPRAPTQPKKDEPFDYRRLLTPPKIVPEFWEAMVFELEVGRPDLAAGHLRSLLAKKGTPDFQDQLLKLHEKEGIATFLRLRLVPRWFEDRAKDKQARDDVESLIEEVTQAVRARLTDAKRIQTYVENLYKLPEQKAFAQIELTRSGAAAMPHMIKELLRRAEPDRLPILETMAVMGHDIVLPLLAALDSEDPILQENLLGVLLRRKDLYTLRARGIEVAPRLWSLTSPVLTPNERVRRAALKVLQIVFDLSSPDHVPSPLVSLTEEAERYYYHQVRFADKNKVPLWVWDGKEVVEKTFTATQVEEMLGMRYAREALKINPTYQPAQLVMLNLRIDKGIQPAPDRPLGVLRPTVRDLLLTLNPDLLNTALTTALRDDNARVILALIEALGKLGDVRSLRGDASGDAPLVRALYHGDRRIQFAAADALLRIPGAASAQVNARILDVLKGPLAPRPVAATRPRLLIASAQERYLADMVRSAEGAGYEPLIASTGRQALKRLLSRADVDAVLIDSTLPDPGLSSLLAQLRADVGLKRLPVFVAAVPEIAQLRPILEQLSDTRARLKALEDELQYRIELRARVEQRGGTLISEENDPLLKDLRKRRRETEDRVVKLSDQYEILASQREDALRKHLEKQKNVWVVSANPLREPRLLAARVEERVREAGMFPLSPVEAKEQLETSLAWLEKMALEDLKGFDVRPIEDAIFALTQSRDVSEASLLKVIRIAGRIPGLKAQRELIEIVVNDKRPIALRVEAADELRRHMQENGPPDREQQRSLLQAVEVAIKQPGLDPNLRDRLTRFMGVLRPNDRTTGQRLRDFAP